MSERFKHFDEFYYLTKNENRDLISIQKHLLELTTIKENKKR